MQSWSPRKVSEISGAKSKEKSGNIECYTEADTMASESCQSSLVRRFNFINYSKALVRPWAWPTNVL